MSYLSRIRINPHREKSSLLLANPRAMHGAVMNAIPDAPTEQRIMWRLDTDNPHRPLLYVLTTTQPDWNHLIEQAGWPSADGEHATVRDYTPLLAQLAIGRQFAFRLTANPVQNTHTPTKPTPTQSNQADQRRSFRIGHRTAAQQLTWFLTRTNSWGFQIPPAHTDPNAPGLPALDTDTTNGPRDVRIIARTRRSFRKKNDGAKPIVLHTATFEGRLTITDPAAFTQRLLNGIGPAKAYGCGLLTLAPLPGRDG